MVDSVARTISKQRTISHLENDQAEAADTVGGLDCQEDAGVGGEESLEDGCLFRVVSSDTNIILEMKTISLSEYLFIYNPEDGDITKKM